MRCFRDKWNIRWYGKSSEQDIQYGNYTKRYAARLSVAISGRDSPTRYWASPSVNRAGGPRVCYETSSRFPKAIEIPVAAISGQFSPLIIITTCRTRPRPYPSGSWGSPEWRLTIFLAVLLAESNRWTTSFPPSDPSNNARRCRLS